MATICDIRNKPKKANKTIGERLLKEESERQISSEEKKKLDSFVREIITVINEGIYICELEHTLSHGDIVCTIISFEDNKIEVYIGNSFVGKMGVYDFLKQENSLMFVRYKKYLEMLLRRQGLEIRSLYTKIPAIFEIRLI